MVGLILVLRSIQLLPDSGLKFMSLTLLLQSFHHDYRRTDKKVEQSNSRTCNPGNNNPSNVQRWTFKRNRAKSGIKNVPNRFLFFPDMENTFFGLWHCKLLDIQIAFVLESRQPFLFLKFLNCNHSTLRNYKYGANKRLIYNHKLDLGNKRIWMFNNILSCKSYKNPPFLSNPSRLLQPWSWFYAKCHKFKIGLTDIMW